MQDANHGGVTARSPGSRRAPETTETAPGNTDGMPLVANLLDLTHDAIFVRSMGDVITYWNRGAEELYGWTRQEAIGQVSHELTQTIFPAPLEEINRALLATGRWEGELVHAKRDGTQIVVASRWSLERDEDGTPRAILETNNDITERKRADQALRQSETALRELIETIPAIAWTVRPDGSDVFVSRRWTEYAGLPAEAMSGSRWLAAVHPDDLDGHVAKWRASVARGVPFENEARLRRAADGEYRWFLVRAMPLHDDRGDVLKWYGLATDIEDRKRAEQALRRSEAHLAEAQRLTHTGSWACSPTGKSTHWSEEMFRIYGMDPRRDPCDGDEFFSRIVHPEDRDRLREASERASRERVEFEQDYRIVQPDGTIKHVHAIGHPVLGETGELIEYVGTVADVTERKHAEEERAAHLWFLESMDRINRAMQGTNDLERMMSDVLDAVLEIFACDRAWLLYPCDPEAPSWRAVMEHTRPEFPGVFALGTDMPIDAE
ncbi:MAG TPA: PAS domain S-box protein, partial [Myxococcota bacterium]|nr:PAS domain S-box protein [Myxococcota bacterium]